MNKMNNINNLNNMDNTSKNWLVVNKNNNNNMNNAQKNLLINNGVNNRYNNGINNNGVNNRYNNGINNNGANNRYNNGVNNHNNGINNHNNNGINNRYYNGIKNHNSNNLNRTFKEFTCIRCKEIISKNENINDHNNFNCKKLLCSCSEKFRNELELANHQKKCFIPVESCTNYIDEYFKCLENNKYKTFNYYINKQLKINKSNNDIDNDNSKKNVGTQKWCDEYIPHILWPSHPESIELNLFWGNITLLDHYKMVGIINDKEEDIKWSRNKKNICIGKENISAKHIYKYIKKEESKDNMTSHMIKFPAAFIKDYDAYKLYYIAASPKQLEILKNLDECPKLLKIHTDSWNNVINFDNDGFDFEVDFVEDCDDKSITNINKIQDKINTKDVLEKFKYVDDFNKFLYINRSERKKFNKNEKNSYRSFKLEQNNVSIKTEFSKKSENDYDLVYELMNNNSDDDSDDDSDDSDNNDNGLDRNDNGLDRNDNGLDCNDNGLDRNDNGLDRDDKNKNKKNNNIQVTNNIELKDENIEKLSHEIISGLIEDNTNISKENTKKNKDKKKNNEDKENKIKKSKVSKNIDLS